MTLPPLCHNYNIYLSLAHLLAVEGAAFLEN